MPDFSAMPEVFVSNAELATAVSRETKLGRLRKLGSRLYTRNLTEPPERIVQRNLWPLVAAYLPGALIADRTALENRPATDGSVFLIADHKRDIVLPGVTLRPRKGPPPLESDRPFIGSLRIASPARAFLENMRPSRARDGVARTFSRREIEERLDEMLHRSGEPALQRLRDDAREIAGPLDLSDELQRLDTLIGTLLGTRDAPLQSSVGIARAAGLPYDPQRLDLFQRLFTELAGSAPVTRLARPKDGLALPFFESYFSNFIEGTEFAVDEAADIVFKGHIPKARPDDAYDVLGTWKVVADESEMSRLPRSFDELATLLKGRHARIMEGRPDKGPGRFKADPNRAGSTLFVAPELVDGTLAKGFEIYRGLASPLHRWKASRRTRAKSNSGASSRKPASTRRAGRFATRIPLLTSPPSKPPKHSACGSTTKPGGAVGAARRRRSCSAMAPFGSGISPSNTFPARSKSSISSTPANISGNSRPSFSRRTRNSASSGWDAV